MTDNTAIKQAIAARFKSILAPTGYEWTTPNVPFKPPNEKPWARLNIRFYTSRQRSIGPKGTRRFETRGAIIIQVFNPIGKATKNQTQMTQVITDGFQGERLPNTSVVFGDVLERDIGPDPHGPWDQTNIEIEFRFSKIK